MLFVCLFLFVLPSFVLSQSYRNTVVKIKAAENGCNHFDQEENDFIDIWLKENYLRQRWSILLIIQTTSYSANIAFKHLENN